MRKYIKSKNMSEKKAVNGKDVTVIPPPSERFRDNMVALTRHIAKTVKRVSSLGYQIVKSDLVSIVAEYLNLMDGKVLIGTFITKSHSDWDKIFKAEEKHFMDNADKIFAGLPVDNINAFKSLFILKDSNGKQVVTEEEKQVIIKGFKSFVKISIHYIHEEKQPYIQVMKKADGTTVSSLKYKEDKLFPGIDVASEALKWGLALKIPQST